MTNNIVPFPKKPVPRLDNEELYDDIDHVLDIYLPMIDETLTSMGYYQDEDDECATFSQMNFSIVSDALIAYMCHCKGIYHPLHSYMVTKFYYEETSIPMDEEMKKD